MAKPGVAYRLDKLYETLPTIRCLGKCHASCGAIGMTEEEWKRLRSAARIHQAERSRVPELHQVMLTAPVCPALDDRKRCSAYDKRPMICRLWGVVETMRCPHGCRPSPRYLTDEQGKDMLALAREISKGR